MAITALPQPPTRSDPVNFNARADAFLTAIPLFATEANTLQADVNAKQIAANTSATNALASENAAAANSNAIAWVSGTSYTTGVVRFSPSTFLSYRRKNDGAGTTDPASDSTNWQLVNGTGNVDLSSTQTLSNKTLSTGSTWFGNSIAIPQGGTGAINAVDAFNNIKQPAGDSYSGTVELATSGEVITGLDAVRVITPAALRYGKTDIAVNLTGVSTAGISAIPAWATDITIMLDEVSTTVGNIPVDIKLNNQSTYVGNVSVLSGTAIQTVSTNTTAIRVVLAANNAVSDKYAGVVSLKRTISSDVWFITFSTFEKGNAVSFIGSYVKDLAASLNTIDISATGSTFSAGSVRVTWS